MPGSRFTDIRRFDSIDSTNRYLLDEARRGAPDGVVAVADHQSAGRGRLGRSWEAPPGSNLLLSVLLRPDLPVGERHLASAAVALAAAEAVDVVTGVRVGIKWPNDLLGRDGRKLAGVLAEADLGLAADGVAGTHAQGAPIVVGIGINVNWPRTDDDLAPELVGSAGSLCQLTGRSVDRARLLEALLGALEPRVDDLDTAPGRSRQAGDFRSRCSTLGTPVRVELAGDAFDGLATDLTPEGHLVVAVGDTTRTVVSGDVVHVRPLD
jgi:BirA family transcriptional regulator, biotin operon repressor / biotin---[acetyl-CoA-carboxylase] ligase